jgi:hypothetical protein
MSVDGDTRKYAAALGRRYFEGSMTSDALFEHFRSSEDALIQELLVAVAHEPRKGFWGIRESRWQKSFWLPVSRLLAELEKGEAGRMPDVLVVPVSGWRVFGFLILIVWAGASAAEHSVELWRGEASWWRLALHAFFAVLLAFATLGGAIGLRDRLTLRRIRRANDRDRDAAG